MKTATITLDTIDTPLPLDGVLQPTTGPFAGFSLTVTKTGASPVTLPTDPKLVWLIGGLIEGAEYSLSVSAVDAAGATIDTMATQAFIVPGAVGVPLTYPRVVGYSIEWS